VCVCDITGDIDGATGLIQRCLEVDQTSSDSHILMAQVLIDRQSHLSATICHRQHHFVASQSDKVITLHFSGLLNLYHHVHEC